MKSSARMNDGVAAKTTTARSSGLEKTVSSYGLPKSSEEDDAFAEMDRLADML